MNCVFIGDDFYFETGSTMSSVYEVIDKGNGFEELKRTDWGFIHIALENGEEVHIVPASKNQLKQMKILRQCIQLNRYKEKHNIL